MAYLYELGYAETVYYNSIKAALYLIYQNYITLLYYILHNSAVNFESNVYY